MPVDEAVFRALGLTPDHERLAAPFPPLGSGRGAWATATAFGLLFGLAAFASAPLSPLTAKPAPLLARPYANPKRDAWVPTPEILKAEEQGLAEIARLQARMKELEAVARTGSPEQRRAAAAESGRLLERVMAIHERIVRMRRGAGAPE